MWYPCKKGPSGFSSSSTAEDVTQGIDATGLTAIVTGASNGIGTETARVLALRGAHVIMPVRNMDAGRRVKEAMLKENPNASIEVMELDLSSMASVRKFASEYNSSDRPLNILINNAGVQLIPYMLSQDGIESHFATNHIGHFLLTNLLLQKMKTTARDCQREGRIVNVSSFGHNFSYRGGIRFDKINDQSSYNSVFAYGQSKLANILHTSELSRRLKEEGVNVTANSLHPGAIDKNLKHDQKSMEVVGSWFSKLIFKSVPQGAATSCYVALNPQVEGVSGKYFSDSNIAKTSSRAKDPELAKKLWDFSLNLTDPE